MTSVLTSPIVIGDAAGVLGARAASHAAMGGGRILPGGKEALATYGTSVAYEALLASLVDSWTGGGMLGLAAKTAVFEFSEGLVDRALGARARRQGREYSSRRRRGTKGMVYDFLVDAAGIYAGETYVAPMIGRPGPGSVTRQAIRANAAANPPYPRG